MLDVMIVRFSKAGESHDHQFDEEQDEDGHEANAFDPRVFDDWTREALIGESFVGRRQQLRMIVSINVVVEAVVQSGYLHV